MTGKSRI